SAHLVFVIEIPPKFQANILAGRQAEVQVNVDATAVTQAGNGTLYITSIIYSQVANFLARREGGPDVPVKMVVRAKFNPNLKSSWFTSVMQFIDKLTLL